MGSRPPTCRIQAAFAWPMLVQAAGLAEVSGTRLQLTTAGRKATAMPAHELVRQVWEKWQRSTLVDEFNRIDVIKGQQAKGRGLTAVAPRRDAVVEALCECPAHKWIATDELFRVLKASAPDFAVTHAAWKLYISEQRYGSLGFDIANSWELLQGRFVLAFLFEYAATLGLLDVAYFSPEGARNDYRDCWGTDELSRLSRYDGLMFFRINALGAWCLDLAETYEPAAVPSEPLPRVPPNLDVVAADRATAFPGRHCPSGAVRRAEIGSHLATSVPPKSQSVEKGLTVGELLEDRSWRPRTRGRCPRP